MEDVADVVETLVAETLSPLPAGGHGGQGGDKPFTRVVWRDPDHRDLQIAVFLDWLPDVLHEAPGIVWEQVPGQVMGYLVKHLPDPAANWRAIPLTLAAACAAEGNNEKSLLGHVRLVKVVLDELESEFGVTSLAPLAKRQIWDAYTRNPDLIYARFRGVEGYAVLSAYAQHHLSLLADEECAAWTPYLLPPLPARYIERLGLGGAAQRAMRERRKAEADVLVPLHPFLVNLALFRKQAAEKVHREFLRVRELVRTGNLTVPHRFSVRTTVPVLVSPHPEAVSDLKVRLEEIDLPLTLWDRRSWTLAHADRYCATTIGFARGHRFSFTDANNTHYLEFRCPAADALWFGDLIAHALVKRPKGSTALRARAARYGFPRGVATERGGLLGPIKPDATYLSLATRPGELLVDWESMYRGILYGAALAVVFLTSGARLSEVQQISMSRWRIQEVNEVRDGRRTGRRARIYLQHLLPKGGKTEAERQLFLMSPEAVGLLKEIADGLAPTPDQIPVVYPLLNNKAEHLRAEPYLFQWNSTGAHSKTNVLDSIDISTLLRFIFYGLDLTTIDGRAIAISPHRLRHAVAASARHRYDVPVDAVAWLLHHRLDVSDRGRGPHAGEATLYYSQAPEGDTLALLHAFQADLVLAGAEVVLPPIEPDDLERLDADMRDTIAQWGTIGLTAFG